MYDNDTRPHSPLSAPITEASKHGGEVGEGDSDPGRRQATNAPSTQARAHNALATFSTFFYFDSLNPRSVSSPSTAKTDTHTAAASLLLPRHPARHRLTIRSHTICPSVTTQTHPSPPFCRSAGVSVLALSGVMSHAPSLPRHRPLTNNNNIYSRISLARPRPGHQSLREGPSFQLSYPLLPLLLPPHSPSPSPRTSARPPLVACCRGRKNTCYQVIRLKTVNNGIRQTSARRRWKKRRP
ncbi:hypothetical protein E2C01_003345 [Portunus trituberculatus]|uniref:Uncharacterized protein n=1 Tax=Portunus trituberculatus TaxID=210409 RepID=A0A5B7CNG6_PORTR|nr:hypothetical protein [Portunus trituberculatus]